MFEQVLYGLNKNGSYKVWAIKAREIDGIGVLNICHGAYGGKITDKQENITEGKQGRSAYEQAVFEAKARIKVQKDKNYRETFEELEDLPVLAMLAKDFAKDGKEEDIKDGFGSKKFDGIRGLAKCLNAPGIGKYVVLESRTGQPHMIPHLTDELLKYMEVGEIWDGEIYLHGPALQEINSAVGRTDTQGKIDEAERKLERAMKTGNMEKIQKAEAEVVEAHYIHEIRPQLQFHVFDVIDKGMKKPFKERLKDLQSVGGRFSHSLFIFEVEYTVVNSYAELLLAHKAAVDDGYEGIMFRTADGVYESGKRSRGLWKFKVFLDKEFRINRTEKDKQGYIVFVLQNDLKDNEFNCVMGDYGWRLAYADVDFRNQWMTVQFQSRFKKTLKPQFPTGKLIRKGTVVNGEFIPSE